MKNFRYLLVLLIFIVFNQQVFGAIERFSSRKDGDAASPNTLSAGASMSVQDDKYYDMSTDPFWPIRFANKNATGTVRLGINPDLGLTTGFSGTQKYYHYPIGHGTIPPEVLIRQV